MWPLGVQHAILLGLVVRLLALALLPGQDFPDARTYLQSGRELFANGSMVSHNYMPLYPIYTYLTGGGLTTKLADIALSLATIWLVWRLSLVILEDRRAALLAALAMALWPHAAFYSVSVLTETTYAFVLCLLFLCLYQRRWFWGLGLLTLSILIRPSLDPLAPFLALVFALLVHGSGWRAGLLRVAQYAAIYLVLMAPWWAHQYSKYDAFVRLNLGDGIVLYAGNNPANRTGGGVGYGEGDGPGITDTNPGHPAYRIKDPMARNRALKAAAISFIRENPGRFVELAGMKFVRFWRLWPFAPAYQTPVIIVISLLSYGLMLAAALIFFLKFAKRRWRMISPILLLAAYLSAIHMITIGSIRYRYPLEPFLIILGCFTLARLMERIPWLDRLFGGGGGPRAARKNRTAQAE
ncbi:MAG: hypothetical protein ACTSUD_07750 [Alphaproteobacteria bacterium]